MTCVCIGWGCIDLNALRKHGVTHPGGWNHVTKGCVYASGAAHWNGGPAGSAQAAPLICKNDKADPNQDKCTGPKSCTTETCTIV